MLQMSAEPAVRSAATVAVGATLVALDGAPPPAAIVDELRREVLDITLASPALFEGDGALERPLIVLWLGAGESEPLLAQAVAWTDARQPRPGLVLCAPTGDRALAEHALALGFDDVVLGPLSVRELAARIRAVHRRVHWTGRPSSGRVRYGVMTLNTDGHEVWIDGQCVALTSMELWVLRTLMRAQGRALSRAELLDAAWGGGNLEISERAVDNVILRLRRKLPRPGLIQTVRGVGFRLVGG